VRNTTTLTAAVWLSAIRLTKSNNTHLNVKSSKITLF